jgi:hypothetical protein
MYSRWFNLAVVLFWLTTMTWLVKDKILPSLVVGEPPTYRTVIAGPLAKQVRWAIRLNDQPVGWTQSKMRVLDNGVTEIRSQVRLDRLPLSEITPGWMGSLLRLIAGGQDWTRLKLRVEADSSFEIDPLGRPIGFHTKALLGERGTWPDRPVPEGQTPPGLLRVTLQGVVDGHQLKLTVRSGNLVHNARVFLPPDALMSDALSPQSRLPDLRVGQSWTMPIYSPLRPPTEPMEVLRAAVERRESILWHGQMVSTWLVVFSSDPGGELTGNLAPRAKAWVADDGDVLKQELVLLSARLVFERSDD